MYEPSIVYSRNGQGMFCLCVGMGRREQLLSVPSAEINNVVRTRSHSQPHRLPVHQISLTLGKHDTTE